MMARLRRSARTDTWTQATPVPGRPLPHGRWREGRRVMERVETPSGVIAYRRFGAGPPLVLLHGGFSDGRSWAPQLTGLADEYDVVAWDAPGCGGSTDPRTG